MRKITVELASGVTIEIPWNGKENRQVCFRRECKRLGIEPFGILY